MLRQGSKGRTQLHLNSLSRLLMKIPRIKLGGNKTQFRVMQWIKYKKSRSAQALITIRSLSIFPTLHRFTGNTLPAPLKIRSKYICHPSVPAIHYTKQLTDRPQAPISPIPQEYSTVIANFSRQYNDKDLLYEGLNDNLIVKLYAFQNICNRIGLPQQYWHIVSPVMLTGSAREFFYTTYKSSIAPFPEIVRNLRQYFEGEEYRRTTFIKWASITCRIDCIRYCYRCACDWINVGIISYRGWHLDEAGRRRNMLLKRIAR